MADLTRWRDLLVLAKLAERHFGLRFRGLEPMTHPRARMYGDCDHRGAIRLRVHHLHSTGRPLAWSTILRTLAHELAHTHPEGWEHGTRHRELERAILAFWRERSRHAA